MKLFRKELLLILAILVLGLFLRIYDLDTKSIWIDEVFSIRMASQNLPLIIEEVSQYDVHPPLYYVILHYWIKLFGSSEFAARFPSVIFGFFALFMIYKVGGLMFDRNVGLFGSLLLALSMFHIRYSQEVRSYELLALVTLFSMYFFLRLLRETNPAVSCGYIISSSLLMYTHVYGFFIIITQNIYLITMLVLSRAEYKHIFRRWVLFQSILVILYIPWIGVLMTQISGIQGDFWISVPTKRSIIGTFRSYSAHSWLLLFIYLTLHLYQ